LFQDLYTTIEHSSQVTVLACVTPLREASDNQFAFVEDDVAMMPFCIVEIGGKLIEESQ
jgi:hypothetical protein